VTRASGCATGFRANPCPEDRLAARLSAVSDGGVAEECVTGVTAAQGENNRDQLVLRGNNTSADFFLDGVRDDMQYYRELYNLERVEALKGPNAMIFGRGGGGGVINRVTKTAEFSRSREVALAGGSWRQRRFSADLDQPFSGRVAGRLNTVYEKPDSFRNYVNLERFGVNPTLTLAPPTVLR